MDSGGYNLKSSGSMAGIKGDMAGGAAVAAAVRRHCGGRIPVNVTAVVPCCENRISTTSLLPGDLIGSLSGKTIEVFNADAEGRLILADGLTWAIRKEGCTHLVDAATLTGAICAMLGYVATGVMASDDGWYAALERAAAHSGERFWRMPDFPEYESSSAATSATCATRAATAAARSRPGCSCGTLPRVCLGCIWTLQVRRTTRAMSGSIRSPARPARP